MEAKHTPGPWRFVPSWNRDTEVHPTYSADGYCNNPFIIGERSEVVGCDEYDVFYGATKAERAANIRLMLAAPEMLAMLHGVKHPVRRWRRSMELCVPDSAGHQNMVEVERELLALIARIEGGTEGGAK
jgi:hypothetical protein